MSNKVNYQQVCQDLLKDLNSKQKEIISRRFGLKKENKETLALIGDRFNITRERVRQIEKDSIDKQIKPRLKKYSEVFKGFRKYLESFGGIKKEDILLEELGDKENQAEVYFLLSISENFKRYVQNANFYPLWTDKETSLTLAKKNIELILREFKKNQKPLTLQELKNLFQKDIKINFLTSCLEISKKIKQNNDLFGLKEWPEINPRGVKDKAYLVLKKNKIPLHFSQIAEMIGENALPQTVHNELIKNQKFVLVGRGTYALEDWGYSHGNVNDVIFKLLKESKTSLSKKEILDGVLKQRMVKKNTVLINLNNKKYFLKTPKGKYKIKEA